LSSHGIYFLYTLNLIISYKNQPLLFTLGGWLEEKNKSYDICKISGEMLTNEWETTYYFLYNFFKLTNQSLICYLIGCTSYVTRIW